MKQCVLISVVCVLTAFGSIQPKPGFDPRGVVRRVHERRGMTDTTSGAARATLRPGHSHRIPRRRRNHVPSHPTAQGRERSAKNREQVPDGSEFLVDTSITLVPAPYDQGNPAVAYDGANFLLVWEDYRDGNDDDIYGARVTPGGKLLDPAGFIISQATDDQVSAAICFDGTDFLVVWEDSRGGGYPDIYGARVTPQGTVLDSQGFVISQAADIQESPALEFDGTNFLVVWEDYRNGNDLDIYGARVTPAGTLLDSAGIAISTAANDQCSAAVAFDGTNFLVVWDDGRGGGYPDIYGARVTPAGTVLDSAGIAICQASDDEEYPALGFDGASFLVVWEDYRNGNDYDIYGARVTPAGTVLDSAGIAISQAVDYQENPALDFDGTNFLVVWEDFRNGNDYDIYGARVTGQGVVLDPTGLVISQAADEQSSAAVAFDGNNSLVVWQDSRDGSDCDIYGARVTPAGVVSDSGPIIRQGRDQSVPALVRGNGSKLFLVYQGWAATVGAKTYNTQRIWGELDPYPGIGQMPNAGVLMTKCRPTIVRGVLYLPEASSRKPQATSLLLDISGRKVMDLLPGANDVSRLAPGVYFVREEPQAPSPKPQAVRKVVLAQ